MPPPTAARFRIRATVLLVLGALSLQAVPRARAHSNTAHAGTPHWVLLALFVVGAGLVLGGWLAARRDLVGTEASLLVAFVGVAASVFGGIGLVELQVVARRPPRLLDVYPLASVLVGWGTIFGSLVVGRVRWPDRPRYAVLGTLLGAWIMYPSVMPNNGYYHPLGYALAVAVPLAVAYVLWTDARGVVQSIRLERRPKYAGGLATGVFCAFFAFSAGTMTLNPEEGAGLPNEAFVVPYSVANPLVAWPAVEFYFPSVPFGGYVSVGTLLLMGLLGGLVGINAALVTQQWIAGTSTASTRAIFGSMATSGATACCCCAPAFYGVVSVVFGAAATPVYWSFLIPTSPVGGIFFAASVLLLVASVLQATGATTAVDDGAGPQR